MSDFFLFAGIPYLALGIFLIGTIMRYSGRQFGISSLSSQFLESNKLFWGSQPFHYGMMILFFGHLIAFAFPRSVVLWNSMPVRVLILEISGFTFALLALFGLIMFVYRRLTEKRAQVVFSKMDAWVYFILFFQVISGIGVAYFSRWGSTWFATTLTPYLRSIFVFDPSIDAVAAMPWWVQLHIIVAFVLIGTIPFSRFMHFLVVPLDYLFRSYQQVIWNYDRKKIRNPFANETGLKPKNH